MKPNIIHISRALAEEHGFHDALQSGRKQTNEFMTLHLSGDLEEALDKKKARLVEPESYRHWARLWVHRLRSELQHKHDVVIRQGDEIARILEILTLSDTATFKIVAKPEIKQTRQTRALTRKAPAAWSSCNYSLHFQSRL